MLRGAIIGAGFWSNYQIPAWQEISGVELVAVYNRTKKKAEAVAQKFGIPEVYESVEELINKEKLDFVDIITDVNTHSLFTRIAAEKGINVICQKPMSSSKEEARAMILICEDNHVNLFIHENFRWQAPVRALKKALQSEVTGRPFKARVSFCSAFPVYNNQPFLKEQEHFIISDVGSHVLDICRFLFGEAKTLYCLTQKVNPEISGEDVANILMEMKNGVQCFVEISYASIQEKESFPQTLALIECEKGTIHLSVDFELKIITKEEINVAIIKPGLYAWADPAYSVVHSSIVDCNRNILNGLKGAECETTGYDNFKTVELVAAAYESALSGNVIHL
ncbi:MAG: Gfo/Idh/MocA family oxidoreductase [Ginsengibacter sp.]